MSEHDLPQPTLGAVVELGERSFIFDGAAWQPSVSPAGQALIQQLGQPREPLRPTGVVSQSGYPHGWPVQVVVSPPDYDRQAKTFITVWLKYVLLVISVIAAAGLIFVLVSGGIFATLMSSLFGR